MRVAEEGRRRLGADAPHGGLRLARLRAGREGSRLARERVGQRRRQTRGGEAILLVADVAVRVAADLFDRFDTTKTVHAPANPERADRLLERSRERRRERSVANLENERESHLDGRVALEAADDVPERVRALDDSQSYASLASQPETIYAFAVVPEAPEIFTPEEYRVKRQEILRDYCMAIKGAHPEVRHVAGLASAPVRPGRPHSEDVCYIGGPDWTHELQKLACEVRRVSGLYSQRRVIEIAGDQYSTPYSPPRPESAVKRRKRNERKRRRKQHRH